MDKESIFFTIFMFWYFSNNYVPQNINQNIKNQLYIWFYFLLYHANECINLYDSFMFPMCLFENIKEDVKEDEQIEEIKKVEVKYQVKFLEDIIKMDKEFIFTDEEEKFKTEKYIEFHAAIMEKEYFENLNKINVQIAGIEKKVTKYEGIDGDYCVYQDECSDSNSDEETKENKIKKLLETQSELSKEALILKDTLEKEEIKQNISKTAEKLARNYVIDKRLEKLENCNVMEFTPLGNVLMMYDKNKESFKFYSDSTIPYRYLEVVARKYVKQFNCRPIYVDMEDELKIAEEKWDKERKEKEDKEEEEKFRKEEAIKNQQPFEVKKNVFTKFKSYNKESGTGHVPTAAPPKNSIPNKKLTVSQENEKILLKQKANRFTYEGKLANFSFLKKTDRKAVDKKFATSFADFKKNILKK